MVPRFLYNSTISTLPYVCLFISYISISFIFPTPIVATFWWQPIYLFQLLLRTIFFPHKNGRYYWYNFLNNTTIAFEFGPLSCCFSHKSTFLCIQSYSMDPVAPALSETLVTRRECQTLHAISPFFYPNFTSSRLIFLCNFVPHKEP